MSNLDQFRKEQYINIETFRKSGEGVKTPVWFVEFENQYCFTTEPQSSKVKRMKNNPAVRMAACKMDGTITGEWLSGTVRFMQGEEIKRMEKLYSKKYGLMKILFELPKIFSKKPERAFIAITLD
jgi:uncharacterized protein